MTTYYTELDNDRVAGQEAEEYINTHNLRVDFGRHKGELYTRVPISYLQWMVNAGHSKADIAQAELDRRGATLPEMEVSGHAIDRASLRHLEKWKEEREKNEGIYAWLHRMALEALEKGTRKKDQKIVYKGIQFVIDDSSEFPVLVTVM